jgi:hypothetical protein
MVADDTRFGRSERFEPELQIARSTSQSVARLTHYASGRFCPMTTSHRSIATLAPAAFQPLVAEV